MALIDGSMLDEIFGPGMPFPRDPSRKFLLNVDGTTIVVSSGTLEVGVIDTPNIAPGAVGPTEVSLTSADIPHSSPSILSTDVHDALEEVALGYIGCLSLSGGTMAGAIDMDGNGITGTPLPSLDTDVMNLASGRILVREGYFYRVPTGYGAPSIPQGALRLTWIRATASLNFTGLPIAGDTLTINGVLLTFDTLAGPNKILIGVDVPTTVANAVSEINACTTNTLDGIPLNAFTFAAQDAGAGTSLHLVVLNEDPPNTPEDGNSKPISATSSAFTIRSFEGGLGTVEDGMLVVDLTGNTLYMYDLMQPATPWVDVSGGGGGPVDAVNVNYTGPAIPNIDPTTPDNIQNILISLNTILGSGVTPGLHAPSHELGGVDELDLTGMSGLLATAQNPVLHAATHELGGVDELDLTGMSGLLATAQTPALHAGTHENGGVDEISVAGLSGKLADLQDAGWLQGRTVLATAPVLGQYLGWNGVAWAPATLPGGVDYDTLIGVTDGSGLSVGDLVYISAADTASGASNSNTSTGPCVGVVVAAGGGLVDVRINGKAPVFVGLVPGTIYYVGAVVGSITTTPPVGSGSYIQEIGIALNTTTLIVNPKIHAVNP